MISVAARKAHFWTANRAVSVHVVVTNCASLHRHRGVHILQKDFNCLKLLAQFYRGLEHGDLQRVWLRVDAQFQSPDPPELPQHLFGLGDAIHLDDHMTHL
eukprot:Skav219941  [mRNA]  locus=scaffold2879:69208:71445:- [translate_table: standard]